MINDCAFVGETLLKYLPPKIEKQHIKRTRGVWSKTFGIAWEILRTKADLYHAHYLLQDCYIASRLGKKPLVGHAHGTDLRAGLKHRLWGRIVRHNLKNCSRILVSTPDILDIARRFRQDAEYLPNPIDPALFYSRPLVQHDGKKKVLLASELNWSVKGTDVALRALSNIKDEVDASIIRYGVDFDKTVALAASLGLHLNVLPKVPHERLNQYFWDADVVVDQFKAGSLGMISLEAIACGRPTITYVSSQYPEYKDFPLKDVDLEERVISAIMDVSQLWQEEHEYLKKNHDLDKIIGKVVSIYREVSH